MVTRFGSPSTLVICTLSRSQQSTTCGLAPNDERTKVTETALPWRVNCHVESAATYICSHLQHGKGTVQGLRGPPPMRSMALHSTSTRSETRSIRNTTHPAPPWCSLPAACLAGAQGAKRNDLHSSSNVCHPCHCLWVHLLTQKGWSPFCHVISNIKYNSIHKK